MCKKNNKKGKKRWFARFLMWLAGQGRPKKSLEQGGSVIEVNGIRFASAQAAERYQALLDAQRKGFIYDLRIYREFTLMEAYTGCDGERLPTVRFCADFTYKFCDNFYALPMTGEVESIVRWFKEMHRPNMKELVVEIIGDRSGNRDYPMMRRMMAERGYAILEIGGADVTNG